MRPMSNSSTRPTSLQRRDFLRAGALAAAATALDVSRGESATASSPAPTAVARAPEKNAFGQNAFELEETTIAALQDGMRTGRYTARSITELYLGRRDAVDKAGPAINSVIE